METTYIEHNERAVSIETTVHIPLNLVWHAWTISERVAEWFAPETVIEATLGGAYELYFVPGNKTGMNTKGCKIKKLVPKKELQFTWKGPDQFADLMNTEGHLTTVSVSFEALSDDTTHVSVYHSGFKQDQAWEEAYKWHQMAWSGVLSSLKSALESGKGDLCCQP